MCVEMAALSCAGPIDVTLAIWDFVGALEQQGSGEGMDGARESRGFALLQSALEQHDHDGRDIVVTTDAGHDHATERRAVVVMRQGVDDVNDLFTRYSKALDTMGRGAEATRLARALARISRYLDEEDFVDSVLSAGMHNMLAPSKRALEEGQLHGQHKQAS